MKESSPVWNLRKSSAIVSPLDGANRFIHFGNSPGIWLWVGLPKGGVVRVGRGLGAEAWWGLHLMALLLNCSEKASAPGFTASSSFCLWPEHTNGQKVEDGHGHPEDKRLKIILISIVTSLPGTTCLWFLLLIFWNDNNDSQTLSSAVYLTVMTPLLRWHHNTMFQLDGEEATWQGWREEGRREDKGMEISAGDRRRRRSRAVHRSIECKIYNRVTSEELKGL